MTGSEVPMPEKLPARTLGANEVTELERLEGVVDQAFDKIKNAADAQRQAMQALVRIKDHNLYRATHTSFEAYVLDRFGKSLSTAKRWVDQGRQILALSEGAGQRGPSWPISSTQGDKPEVIDADHMELDGKGAGVLDLGTVKSAQTPNKGGRGRSPEGTPKSPQGADLRAGAPPETGDEGQSDTGTPPTSSTPHDGGDTSTPATPPPSGPPEGSITFSAILRVIPRLDDGQLNRLADLVTAERRKRTTRQVTSLLKGVKS